MLDNGGRTPPPPSGCLSVCCCTLATRSGKQRELQRRHSADRCLRRPSWRGAPGSPPSRRVRRLEVSDPRLSGAAQTHSGPITSSSSSSSSSDCDAITPNQFPSTHPSPPPRAARCHPENQWSAALASNPRVAGSIPALVHVSLSKTPNPELLAVAVSTVF